MLPTPASGPFDDPAYLFEPWWPGTRVIAVVAGGRVRLQADELADVAAAFPELADLPGRLAATDAILEGIVLVLGRGGRPDPELLRRRLADPRERPGSAAFVATDLLAVDGRRTSRRPFAHRRDRLGALVQSSGRCTVSRGYPGEGRTLATAAAELGFRWLSAHRLDAPYRSGPAGDAWFRVPTTESGVDAPEPSLPPILAVFRRLPLGE